MRGYANEEHDGLLVLGRRKDNSSSDYFGKPRAEVIHFMVNLFGVPRDDAEKIHDRIAVDVRNNQKNIRWGK